MTKRQQLFEAILKIGEARLDSADADVAENILRIACRMGSIAPKTKREFLDAIEALASGECKAARTSDWSFCVALNEVSGLVTLFD